jgi:hypothetical protein
VLAALGEQLDALLDVTIVYPGNKAPGFWDLLNGSISRVIIDIQVRELDPALWAGDYENDPVFRQTVQSWVNQLWVEKDQRIEELRAECVEAIAGNPLTRRSNFLRGRACPRTRQITTYSRLKSR